MWLRRLQVQSCLFRLGCFTPCVRGTVVRSTEVWQHLVEEIKLPSGYTPSDYDALSLRARGYGGWGGIHLPMPPNVFPLLSGSALVRQEEDPNFKLYVDALLVQ